MSNQITSAASRPHSRWLASCAIGLALVVAGKFRPAEAQVLGTGVAVSGASNPTNFGNVTNVNVTGSEAIINWTPTDNAANPNAPINFLNSGSELNFSGSGDYTVLNRILPTDTSRPIRIDGAVNTSIGGKLWFYTPGGLIIGGNARFNVGALVLSANDIDTNGGLFGANGQIRFRGVAGSQSAITVEPAIGAVYQFQLTLGDNYLAMVAPRVSMAGGAFVNGSTAYVAAEQVDITINQGLFDISVLPGGGTTVTTGNALSHSGARGSGTPGGPTDIQRTYMVAVPKNDAITMLVGGTLGHGATGVIVDNGTVILSGGYDIAGGIITNTPSSNAAVDLNMVGGDYFSEVVAHTTGALTAAPRPQAGDPNLASDILFRQDATLIGDVSATVETNFGETVTARGSLTVRSGGIASVFADASTAEFGYGTTGGTIAVAGDLTIDSSNTGASNFAPGGIGTAAVGGLAQLVIDGGFVTVDGDAEIRSDGIGGYGTAQSGNGTGGTASLSIDGNGAGDFGTLLVTAGGRADGGNVASAVGGTGTGGTAEITLASGTLSGSAAGSNDPLGSAIIRADGFGGRGTAGGDGRGGNASFTQTGGIATVSTLQIAAEGYGASADNSLATAGDGFGGTAGFTATGGTFDGGFLSVGAAGYGGNDAESNPGFGGGNGTGGSALFTLNGGAVTTDFIDVSSAGEGGDGADGSASSRGSDGGDGLGGIARLDLLAGALNTPSVSVRAGGSGGAGGLNLDLSSPGDAGDGGAGRGGTATFRATAGAFTLNDLSVGASGVGGTGADAGEMEFGYGAFLTGGGSGGDGGAGTGGSALVDLGANGVITTLAIQSDGIGGAGGFGGAGGLGGDGFGGATDGAILRVTDAIVAVNTATISANASGGRGGDGFGGTGRIGLAGNGGNALGGLTGIVVTGAAAQLTIAPPSLTPSLPNRVTLSANGAGGAGGSGDAADSGGPTNAANGGNGGTGAGGTARFSVTDGSVFAGANVSILATGLGGEASAGVSGVRGGEGGFGGNATGGTAELNLVNARLDRITPSNINDPVQSLDWTIAANALGGGGGNGGDSSGPGVGGGTGGYAGASQGGTTALRTTNSAFRLGDLTLDAQAEDLGNGTFGAGNGLPASYGPSVSRGGVVIVSNTDSGGNSAPAYRSIDTLTMTTSGLLDGGQITVTDTATSPNGGLLIGALLAESLGNPLAATSNADIRFVSGGNPLSITGDATINSNGTIRIDADGNGTIAVGGSFAASGRSVLVRHSNVPAGGTAVPTIAVTNAIDIFGRDGVTSESGSIVAGLQNVRINADTGNIAMAEVRGANLVRLQTNGGITLGNAQVTGTVSTQFNGDPAGGRLELFAGSTSGFGAFAPSNVTFTGRVDATGSILVQAGGDIRVVSGANLVSNNLVRFQSGDDIIVETGASVGAAANPLPEFGYGSTGPQSTPGQLVFDAGAILTAAPVPGNIAAILIDGAISAPNRAITLNGDAIQADTSPIQSRNFYATISNAPAVGAAANTDGGQLRSDCAGGNICLGTLNATNIVQIGPQSGTFGLPNAVRFNGQINATDVTIRARDTIVFQGAGTTPVNITGAANLFIATQNGDVILDEGTVLSGGSLFRLYAGGAIDGPGGTVRATGDMALYSGGALDLGTVDVGGALQTVDFDGGIANANALTIPASITIGDLIVRGGGVSLISANGDVTVARDLDAVGAVTASGRNVSLTTLRDVTIAQATATNGTLSIVADGLAAFQGTASGASISVVSGDIDIGANARIGVAGITQSLDLRNGDSGRRTYIGGAANSAGYSLSADEMLRLYADNIRMFAPSFAAQGPDSVGSARAPDVIVGAFTLNAGTSSSGVPGNLGQNGTLRIETPGKLRVTGAVSLTGLGTGNRFEIAADDALEVISGAGSIDMRGANNALQGVLELSSDDIIVGTLQAISDVGAATTTGAIDARLALNDGVVSDEGALRAGGIAAIVTGGFYVQNTGATSTATGAEQYASRRGFTVGAGGLSINTNGSTSRIVINGRQVNPTTGGFVTGLDFVPLVTINDRLTDRAGFDAASTINGCTITATGACVRFNASPPIPTRDVVEEPVRGGEDGFGNNLPTAIIELGDFERFGFEPLVDEPVTGAGNDDFWTPDCAADAEGNCAPPAGK